MRCLSWLPALVLAPGLAQAQDEVGFDGHGFALAPGDGDLKDYLSTWRAERQDAFSFGIEGLVEYANQPVVIMLKQGEEVERIGIIEHLLAVDLGVAVSVHERIAITVAAPIYLFQSGSSGLTGEKTALGPAFGDLRLAIPVNLLYLGDPKEKGAFGLSIIPFGVAPTGPTPRFLGSPGFGGGGLVAFSYDRGPFDISFDVGGQYKAKTVFENLTGGPDVIGAVGVAYEITDRVALRGEANAVVNVLPSEDPDPGTSTPSATEVPIQAALSTRAYLSEHIALTAGLGTAVTRGIGAAPLRVFIGIHGLIGKKHPIDKDGDGILDSADQCKDEAEAFNEYKDDDGCPDDLAAVTFEAIDQNGNPVQGVVVSFNEESIGLTNSRGLVTTSDQMPETTVPYQASAVGYLTMWGEATLTEGAQTIRVQMPWEARPVRVIAKDPDGNPVVATTSFAGDNAHDPVDLGDDGQEVIPLLPGGWVLTLSSATHESARAPLTLAPGNTEEVVEVTMTPKRVALSRTEVVINDMIHFDFDKATIRPDSSELIDEIAKILADNPQVTKVEIQGHTSDEGTSEYNMDLSSRRMDAVVSALAQRGIDASRLVARGFGETQPLNPNDSEEHRAANRRVVFVILEQDTAAPQ